MQTICKSSDIYKSSLKRKEKKISWGFKVTLDMSRVFPNHTNNDLVFFAEFYGESVSEAWKNAVDCYEDIKSLQYTGYCAVGEPTLLK